MTPKRPSIWRIEVTPPYSSVVRWLLLMVLIACDPPAMPGSAVEKLIKPVVEAPAEIAENEEAIPEAPTVDLDELPEILTWMPGAERCGRHGQRRFCNGPRRVPEPVGAAARIATELGLGTHRAAAELIRTRPRPEWIAALPEHGVEPPTYPLHWPVDDGRFGRGIRFRGRTIGHRGIDVTAEVGTRVRAVADAMVGYANNTIRGYGNLLVLIHGGGEVSAYAHLSAIHVFPGQVIRRGQVVALAGNTGISRGPHLHMEWREDGNITDPMRRFPLANVPEWMRERLASR